MEIPEKRLSDEEMERELRKIDPNAVIKNGIVVSFRSKMAQPSKEWIENYNKSKILGKN